jgi:ribosome maturation factor RimP
MGSIGDRVYALAREVADGLGYELEDVEMLGNGRRVLLRVTIDKEGGVTLDDCASFSKDFGALLDVEDPMQGRYTLEVSSPGLDRPLKTLEAFGKHVGKLARVVTREKVDNQKFIVGRIQAVEGGTVVLLVGKERLDIDFKNISKARLEVELN